MNVLVIGGGGREHCLAWKLAQSAQVETVFVAPGNAGTATEKKLSNVAIDVMDFEALTDFAGRNAIALTVVGPEAPLVAGIVDHFKSKDLPCFGPGKAAAQLEGSKSFSKDFLKRLRYSHGGLPDLYRFRCRLNLHQSTRRAHCNQSRRPGRRQRCSGGNDGKRGGGCSH